jgi:mono/diheme cytochrome c family protein
MLTRMVVSLVLAPVVFFGTVAAQDQPKPRLRNSVMKATSPASGKEMFNSYCAVCHGEDGKGRGPAARALKKAPADLTRLSKNNKGKYPWMKVNSTILGTSNRAKHEMPEWGPLFRSASDGHDSEVSQRVTNLTEYVKGLQAN